MDDWPTALKIPAPRGDGIRYKAWFALYRRARQLRHHLGLHDWVISYPDGDQHIRCSWCGSKP